jgi:5-enolpyruvylshikimate-3-phosphate synthase
VEGNRSSAAFLLVAVATAGRVMSVNFTGMMMAKGCRFLIFND